MLWNLFTMMSVLASYLMFLGFTLTTFDINLNFLVGLEKKILGQRYADEKCRSKNLESKLEQGRLVAPWGWLYEAHLT
jgi:hypothetical protein